MYIRATEEHAKAVFHLVQDTINRVYPKYYPREIVHFFCCLHNDDAISEDINRGHVGVLIEDSSIIGTGCFKENHITRVYVAPEFQGKGYGSQILRCLENEIASNYETAVLDASLPAALFYEHRGYKTLRHETCTVGKEAVLVYEIMEKKLATLK